MAAATREHRDIFAPIKWAEPILTSPQWVGRERWRGELPRPIDRYCRETVRSNDSISHWLELYEQPKSGHRTAKSVTLCKFGNGFTGFAQIAHGGALLTLMDEALGFLMIANEVLEQGDDALTVKAMGKTGVPIQEVLEGRLVTAKLDFKFMKPVFCPGMVGIEVEMLEHVGHKMKMRGVMKDENGVPLLQADGLWVRIGGAPKM